MRSWPRLLLVAMLVTPAWGCVEMIFALMTPAARFEHACGPATLNEAVKDDEQAAFRAYDGSVVKRQEIAVVVVPAISDSCVRHDPHTPYWTPYIVSVDERREVLGPDRKTGKERLVRLPQNCVHCDECLRLALMPGPHVMTLGVWTGGSVAPDRKYTDLRGSAQFQARAGGLYSIYACQPGTQKQPLFWVRDEGTLACVSTTCPEG